MPSVATQTLPRESLTTFLGVDLRRDGLSLADTEVLSAINADLTRVLGAITRRQGSTLIGTIGAAQAIRTLATQSDRRYQAASTVLYRNFAAILTGLHGTTLQTTLAPYRPLNDTTTWSFIADQGLTPLMRKDNGTVVRNWGIAAPVAAPTLGLGPVNVDITGDYGAVYTYARYVDGQLAHESNPSPAPAAISLIQFDLAVTVVASSDPQVTNINIYRTLADGTLYFFDQTVANTSGTYTSSQVDSELGTEVEVDNDPPVPAFGVVEFQGHLFTYGDPDNPDYLWYSKRFRPESFPPEQFLKLGDPSDPLQAAVALTGQLGVLTRLTKYRVVGNAISGFVGMEALNTRGIVAPQAAIVTTQGAGFVARDGIFLTNFSEPDREVSQGIAPLFAGQTVNGYAPIDFDSPDYLSLAEYKRRLFFNYRDTAGTPMLAVYSVDTQHWYHYAVSGSYRLYYEEVHDALLLGDTGGQVAQLEAGLGDLGAAVTCAVVTAPRAGGNRSQKKPYKWLALDSSGVWSADVALDGVTAAMLGVHGARRQRVLPLPARTSGYDWRATLSSMDPEAAVYGVEMLYDTHQPGEVAVEDPGNPGWFLQILPGQGSPLPLPRRRFTFLRLDADSEETSTTTGIWTVDLYVDDVLATSVDVIGHHAKHWYKLPDELTGYEWYVRARYAGLTAPLLHALDVLDTGPPDGQVWVESFLYPDAMVQLIPTTQPPAALQRKRFAYVKWDAEGASGVWTIDVYIDMVLRHRLQIAGNRTRGLHRLPPNLQGFAWHLRARYSLASIPVVYGAQVLSQDLQVA